MLGLRAVSEVVSLGLIALVAIWVSRAVGPTNLGYYAILLALFQLGVVLINFGTPDSRCAAGGNGPVRVERAVVGGDGRACGLCDGRGLRC